MAVVSGSGSAGTITKSLPTTTQQKIDSYVSCAVKIANDNRHGYSNESNWGNPDYDCGSFVSAALCDAGLLWGGDRGKLFSFTGPGGIACYFEPLGDAGEALGYVFEEAGLHRIAYTGMSDLKKGDIVVSEGHVEMYLGDGQLIGAHSNWDGVQGDSSGQEISVGGFYEGGWIWVYRLGAGGVGGTNTSSTESTNHIVQANYVEMSDEDLMKVASKSTGYSSIIDYEDITTTKVFQGLTTATGDVRKTNSNKLLSYPSYVETPFIILKVGEYTFGTYTKGGDLNTITKVTYPNFITKAEIDKVNGTVNTYNITLTYGIEAGNDPNLIDKILSKTGYGKVYISYGDWSCPTFIYKEEEAIITKVTMNADFSNSKLTYNIYCTSNSIALASTTFNFGYKVAKPSDVIFEMLYNNQYGLLDVFPGMRNKTTVLQNGLIPTNDQEVELLGKVAMDPLSYLNYLVTCMSSNTNNSDSILRDSSYFLTIEDDSWDSFGGPYFRITEVKSQTQTLATADTYEVDVGFPSENQVINFTLSDDNSWSLLYNFASGLNEQMYMYSLDDDGKIVTTYSPNIVTSGTNFITTETQKAWWTNMTQFPVQAVLTIKGLVRPAMLMTYLRINSFFYGHKHVSSGLYIITKQTDTVDGNGYRTTLTLTRIGGDNDYISSVTKAVTRKAPIVTVGKDEDKIKAEFNRLKSVQEKAMSRATHVSSTGEITSTYSNNYKRKTGIQED